MYEEKLIKLLNLTEGEAKVYLALLQLGSSTTGPIVEKSKVARSFIYNILNSLIYKGIVSYVTKDKTKYFQAAVPTRLLDYIELKKQHLDKDKKEIETLIPKLKTLQSFVPRTETAVYEGFKGIQTAYEHIYDKLKKGGEYICWGNYPTQLDKYHAYWQRDHKRRVKKGIKVRMLFDNEVDEVVLKNRNSYTFCDTRRMHKKLKMPTWFLVYKNTVTIIQQENPDFQITKALAVEIVNQEIADTFKTIFEDYWKKTEP